MTVKGKFLRKLNGAFAKNDIAYLAENVTEDIHWMIIGDRIVDGKGNFVEALKEMAADEPLELTTNNIITHGDSAAVDGTMRIPGEEKVYAFCDVYKFSGSKNPKVKAITSYVVEVN